MSDFAAARLEDPIAHTSIWAQIAEVAVTVAAGVAVGFVAGLAAAAIVGATVLTGGAATVAVFLVAGALSAGVGVAGLDDAISWVGKKANQMVSKVFPPEECGKIAEGATNVYINKKPAARAIGADDQNKIACETHPGGSPTVPLNHYLAEGSATVFINGAPASRQGDQTTCGAKISGGSGNVRIGGKVMATREVGSEVPWWLNLVAQSIGIALALCKGKWQQIPAKLGCLAVSMGAGMATDYAFRKIFTSFGNPVHAASGAKLLDGSDDQDFALPARMPLVWVRRYNSLDLRDDGPFGQGWSVPLSIQLKLNQPGEWPNLLIDEQGREIPFTALALKESLWNSAEGWRLARTAGGHYIAEDVDGQYYDFGAQQDDTPHTLNLYRKEDRNGNGLTLRYSDDQRLTDITDSAGRHYRCAYHDKFPRRVIGVAVRRPGEEGWHALVRYQYDAAGWLAGVVNERDERVRQFSWHDSGAGAGLLASHTLPDGLVCEYQWAHPAGTPHPRVVMQRTSDGQSWEAAYDLNAGQTRVTDQSGRIQQWAWNARYQVTAYTNALGETWHIRHNDGGLITGCVAPDGGEVRLEYNERGQLVKETDPLGRVCEFKWNQTFYDVDSEILPDGGKWDYLYDTRGNLVDIAGPEKQHTALVRDEHGQPIAVTDARGGTRLLTWSEQGQLATHTDCSGRMTQYRYDHWGWLRETEDAAGHITQTDHNLQGQLLGATLADNTSRRWGYTPAGRLAQYRDGLNQSSRWRYNLHGQVTDSTDAAGRCVRYGYDVAGRLTRLTNGNGQQYRFSHDAADQLTEQVGLDGQCQHLVHNTQGLPVRIEETGTQGTLLVTHLKRDLVGRLTEKRTADSITTYRYNAADRLTAIERCTPEETPLDSIHFSYDGAGNLLSETTLIYPEKPQDGPVREQSLTHAYDILGNRTETQLPDGNTLKFLYYGSGHLCQINWNTQIISEIERDSLHREASRSQGHLTGRYHYDAMSRQTESWSQAGAPHRMPGGSLHKRQRYDANGELVTRTDPLSGRTDYQYDPVGQITQVERRPVLNSEPVQQTRYFWDAAGNPVQVAWQGLDYVRDNRLLAFNGVRCEYDEFGRLKTRHTRNGHEQRFSYNAEHQLTQVTVKQNGVEQQYHYRYDALGRRIAKRSGDEIHHFLWDGMRLLQESERHATVTYVYEHNSYAPLARIDQKTDPLALLDTPPETQIYWLHTHINGAPEEMTDVHGREVWRGRYNAQGKLEDEQQDQNLFSEAGIYGSSLPQNLRNQGQYVDRETGLYYNTLRYFDPEVGRFTQTDPIGLRGGLNLYQYGPNPLSWIDPLGLTTEYKSESPYHGRKPTYVNPGHHDPSSPDFRGGGSKTTHLPPDAEEVYRRSVPSDSSGNTWFGRNSEGEFYRYQGSNSEVHWNGREKSDRGLKIPKWIRDRFNQMAAKIKGSGGKCG